MGGKAANLGLLISAGFAVPPGFVVPVEAYENYISDRDIRPQIVSLINSVDYGDEKGVESCSRKIKDLIIEGLLDHALSKGIDEEVHKLDRSAL